jgi:hypothetical protein
MSAHLLLEALWNRLLDFAGVEGAKLVDRQRRYALQQLHVCGTTAEFDGHRIVFLS